MLQSFIRHSTSEGTLKTLRTLFAIGIHVLAMETAVQAMDDPIYLFGDDAKKVLDSLEDAKSDDFFHMGVLAHNLSFSLKNAKMTDRAKEYFSLVRLKGGYTDTLSVYECLLVLLSIRDQNIFKKGGSFIGGIVGLVDSPEDAAREAFKCLSREIGKNPDNLTFHFLRATAAVEAADLLPDLLPVANEDLIEIAYLLAHQPDVDSSHQFFFSLISAKYRYRLAKSHTGRVWDARRLLLDAHECMRHVELLARGKWQKKEVPLWNGRIEELFRELDD
ncbi:MAG: hypothetical protein A2898_01365 [Candidatus Kerfeldbacteria bacterium RIFCSPLOWO2_01_FULL_48_11]|uniref:Uncharacterized protein n=1 Tax=Candidatus Kerfeldbacteria bacterium RIFCSPLOWO2_01_FULL_48_11 TaxID=1798543 RepID=A0A1G2AZY9_9BACT|nr:MAG: hypothetical protein UY34_C0013G0014 [Parcubacteria group bacterium GW2011_GWA2_48_9]KKW15238.1 MAG: hypothetical protein UY52_C0019G0022 [Parcubacteria group bacterium GW2011_GWC2_49_9]OGY82502.1 MAG: hypothetical protein A2898_01365 [Candidatus Kerfeldbacteria bacterium RIFCSPLOWO2_01_FULL_48_11]HCJ52925.1 hypothetical protein [Candidatus Kerfeldbacteria bacterium]HCM68605.1 hypothetical protein [Candidatus Kerfeldbacteria bacterium]